MQNSIVSDHWTSVMERSAADSALSILAATRPSTFNDPTAQSLYETYGLPYFDLRGFIYRAAGSAENYDAEIDILGWGPKAHRGVQLARLRYMAGSANSTARPEGGGSTAKTWYEADGWTCRGGIATPQIRLTTDGQSIACLPTFGFSHLSFRVESLNPSALGAIDSVLILGRRAAQSLGARCGAGKRIEIIAAAATALATSGGTLTTAAVYIGDAAAAALNLKNTNGGSGPTAAPSFQVQLSHDNSSWFDFGAPYQANIGNNVVTSWGGQELPTSAHFVRLSITRPTGFATTYEAAIEKEIR